MRGVIYVDILFFVNALIGYFLLRGAALLAGRIAADWRIFLGAAAAGLSSLLLLLPPLPQWLMWGAKIGSAVLIVFASFPVHNVRGFLKCCFWYVFSEHCAFRRGICGYILWCGAECQHQ